MLNVDHSPPSPWAGYLDHIKRMTKSFWAQRPYKDYGRLQNANVWIDLCRQLDAVASIPRAEALTSFEIFLLRAVAHVYEIGWQSPDGRRLSQLERYAVSGAMIRASGRRDSKVIDLGLSELEPTTVEVLARICESIGQQDLSSLDIEPEPAGYQEQVRLRYLVALFHLADLLFIHRANEIYFRHLTALDSEDIENARLALQPYIPLVQVKENGIKAYFRLHPDDEHAAEKIRHLFEEPILLWLARNRTWLNTHFHYSLELHESDIGFVRQPSALEPIEQRCRALVEFLAQFTPIDVVIPPVEEPRPEVSVGQILANTFEVSKIVKRTNHSQIIQARDLVLQRDVAIKLIYIGKDLANDAALQLRQNLLREARILAELNNLNIGRVYTVIQSPFAVVMQWIEGTSLQDILDEEVYLPITDVIAMGIRLASVLAYVHAAGVTHRDIKPANIIINVDNEPIVIDFDISRAKTHETITRGDDGKHVYVGSPSYSAPEQFRHPETVGAPADLFSLGVVLYQLATHRIPYSGRNNFHVYGADNLQLPPLEQQNIPPQLYAILFKLLNELPEQRPSAIDLATDLRNLLLDLVLVTPSNVSVPHILESMQLTYQPGILATRVTTELQHSRSQQYMDRSKVLTADTPKLQTASEEHQHATSLDQNEHAMEPAQVTLHFRPSRTGATIIWDSDMIGHITSKLTLPFKHEALPTVIKALDASQHPDHPLSGPRFNPEEQALLTSLGLWSIGRVSPEIHRIVGQELYKALTRDRKGSQALTGVREGARHMGKSLSYNLRFPQGAIELAALPWELVWDDRQAVLLSRGVRDIDWCQRYLDIAEALSPPLPAGRKLHVLTLLPHAGIPEDVRNEERAARLKTWGRLRANDLLDWDELSPVTMTSLDDRMRRGPTPDIIHFYGHGVYQNGRGYLIFDNPTLPNQRERVDGSRLSAQLGGIRLIVIHACQSAMVNDSENQGNLLTGIAPALSVVSEAVVAMQLTVRISAATRFSEVFYEELARGRSLQAAVAEARRSLYVIESDGASWYVPTLYVRTREQKPIYLLRA